MTDESRTTDELRLLITMRGYAVIAMRDLETFKATCAALGKVDPLIDVRIVPGETQYPFRPAAVPFHTDHPRHDIVAWYCIKNDATDGANLLVDTRMILERLSPDVHERLQRAQVRVVHSKRTQAILTTDPCQIYWLPPLIRETIDSLDREVADAIRVFQHELDAVASTGNVAPIRLNEGEALFVNNHAVLHGRRSIPSHSQRHLVRACVTGPRI